MNLWGDYPFYLCVTCGNGNSRPRCSVWKSIRIQNERAVPCVVGMRGTERFFVEWKENGRFLCRKQHRIKVRIRGFLASPMTFAGKSWNVRQNENTCMHTHTPHSHWSGLVQQQKYLWMHGQPNGFSRILNYFFCLQKREKKRGLLEKSVVGVAWWLLSVWLALMPHALSRGKLIIRHMSVAFFAGGRVLPLR